MIAFSCPICRAALTVPDHLGGQLVRCSNCQAAVRTPEPALATVAVAGGSAATVAVPGFRPSSNRRPYGFPCPYCSSRLEATDSMAAQEGQCPTCGNQITIPIRDRYGRLIDPKTRQIIKQDPHPVHAYAAAGERAPKIIRIGEDKRYIQCPRCLVNSPITANNCKSCQMPFTMEGTTSDVPGGANGWCVAALVLGIVGIPAAPVVLPPVLAVVFGIVGMVQLSKPGVSTQGRGMAIAGIVCGVIGCLIAAHYHDII